MKAPWRRFLDLIVETFLGRQPVSGKLGALNNVLAYVPGAGGELTLTPVPLGSLSLGSIGLDFVFQPGGPVPAGAANIFTTEASLWAAVNAELATNGGPLTIAIDSSLGAATFATPHDYLGRVALVGANADVVSNVLTVTAMQSNIPSFENVNFTFAAGGTAVFTPAVAEVIFKTGTIITKAAPTLGFNIAAGQALTAIWEDDATFTPTTVAGGAGNIFNMNGGGSSLSTVCYGFPGGANSLLTAPGTNFVGSIAGVTWTHAFDASWALLPDPAAFGGTFVQVPLDGSRGVLYDLGGQPALKRGATFGQFLAGRISQQEASGMHMSPAIGTGAAYTLDTGGLDETVDGGVAGLVYTCPAGFPIGREFTLIDASGGVGGNAFAFTPTAPETIGTAAAGVSRVFTQVEAKAVRIKKVSATNWRVVSSTSLV